MVTDNDMSATNEAEDRKPWQTPLVIEATLRDETEKPTFVAEFTPSFGAYGPS
jgi:hypothetical protein